MALERYRAFSAEIKEQAPGFETGLQIIDDVVASLQRRGLLPKAKDFLKKPETEVRAATQEITLPEPSPEIIEVYHMLMDNGFDVAQIVYVDRQRREVTHAVIETVVRPPYTDGTQMYYPDPENKKDPLAAILERGRAEQKIAVFDFTRHVPAPSRFALSWDEIDNFVAPEVIKTTPQLAELVRKSGIVLRVPTKAEFQEASKSCPHFGEANSLEWLYDHIRRGRRLSGGGSVDGGLSRVYPWRYGYHDDNIGFRLQAVSLSQKIS